MTTSSNGSVPRGLELYEFTYKHVYKEMPATVTCLSGKCDPMPSQAWVLNDDEAIKFAKLYAAETATHAISGRILNLHAT